MPEFVFMLTRDDATVTDAHAILDDVEGLGLQHIGFKDVGLPMTELNSLAARIHDLGAVAYLEVVSTSRDDELRSVEAALTLGVDVLLGGTHAADAIRILAGAPIRYFPFPGTVVGHPSRLHGPADAIVESARTLADLEGVHGLDLLAYRFDGDVASMTQRVVDAVPVPVLAAGSVDSHERIAALARAGVWGFTVGTAVLNATMQVEAPTTGLRDLLAATAALAGGHDATIRSR